MAKKVATEKRTLGKDLLEDMRLVLAHQRGEVELEQVWPKPVNVKVIRKRLKMSHQQTGVAGVGARGPATRFGCPSVPNRDR
jgi:hypothetical protein